MGITLQQYVDSPEARAELMNFYREVYPDAPWQLDDARFDWQNLKNPLQQPGQTEIWLLRDDHGALIGHNIYILYTLRIGGKPYRGICSTNLIVKPGLVGKGIGHKLIDCNEQRGGVAYAVGITPASTRAFVKRGWVPVNDARLFMQVVNPGPNLRYLGFSPLKAVLATPVLKALSLAHAGLARLRVPRALPGVGVRPIKQFDPAHDEYWQKYLEKFAIHFDRNARHLNYKYASRSDTDHSILLFEKDDRPIGYGVYRLSVNTARSIRLGRLVDLVADPGLGETLVTYMIGVMKRRLAEHKVDGFVGVAANDEIAGAYRRNGFFLSRIQPAIIREDGFREPESPASPGETIAELRQRYPSLWYITLGDSDLDNYW